MVNYNPGISFPREEEVYTFHQNQNDGVQKKTNNFKFSTELGKYFPSVTEKRQETWISIQVQFYKFNIILLVYKRKVQSNYGNSRYESSAKSY